MGKYNYYKEIVYLGSFFSNVCLDLHQLYLPKQQIYMKFRRLLPYRIAGKDISQSAFTCSKFTIETLEQGVKYVKS